MTDDLVSRDALRELLFDGELPPPPSPEEMFDRTFAADGDAGADLLPPDTLYDEPAVDGHDPLGDDLPGDDLPGDDLPGGDPLGDDLVPDPVEHLDHEDVTGGDGAPDAVDDPAQHPADAPEHGDPVDHPGPHDLDPGTGW